MLRRDVDDKVELVVWSSVRWVEVDMLMVLVYWMDLMDNELSSDWLRPWQVRSGTRKAVNRLGSGLSQYL